MTEEPEIKPFVPPKEKPTNLESADGESQDKIRELVELITASEKLHDKLEEEAKNVAAKTMRFRALLLDVMDSIGMTQFRMKDVGLVYIHNSPKASVLKADKEELMQWLKDHGHGDIVKEDVNTNTLKAFVRGLREEGQPLPPLVREWVHREPRIRKSS